MLSHAPFFFPYYGRTSVALQVTAEIFWILGPAVSLPAVLLYEKDIAYPIILVFYFLLYLYYYNARKNKPPTRKEMSL